MGITPAIGALPRATKRQAPSPQDLGRCGITVTVDVVSPGPTGMDKFLKATRWTPIAAPLPPDDCSASTHTSSMISCGIIGSSIDVSWLQPATLLPRMHSIQKRSGCWDTWVRKYIDNKVLSAGEVGKLCSRQSDDTGNNSHV